MAKKFKKRMWYLALFKEDADKVFEAKEIPNNAILFNDANSAYQMRLGERMRPARDENGELILQENGMAKLNGDKGKISVFEVYGSAINWDYTQKILKRDYPGSVPCDMVRVADLIDVNKQTVKTVYEETDEMYSQFVNSPLAQAGGVENATSTTEDVQSEA